MLSAIFARGAFHDPDLADILITVTEVRMSPDLKHATAFVTRLGRTDIAAKLPALKRAAPFFRAQLAHEMRLRVAPDVTFLGGCRLGIRHAHQRAFAGAWRGRGHREDVGRAYFREEAKSFCSRPAAADASATALIGILLCLLLPRVA